MKPQGSILLFTLTILSLIITGSCNRQPAGEQRIPVILDTDANNELDDQHAIAYMVQSQDRFDIRGITVNATYNGGLVEKHYEEAVRVLKLFNRQDRIDVKKGANGTFAQIREHLDEPGFDGQEAVDFIIEEAGKYTDEELVLLPIGKLTNIALALEKAPEITGNVRVVWLGSNYPQPGEYNLENDTSALRYILESDVHFEMATVSYGRPTGTWAILVSVPEIDSVMPGKGPLAEEPVEGRHGGMFNTFGDYSVSLFHHIDLYGDPPSRSLYDVGAVAVVKNPAWAEPRVIPGPVYDTSGWTVHPELNREIIIWENFRKDSIIADLFKVLEE